MHKDRPHSSAYVSVVLDLWLPLAMGQRLIIAPTAMMKDFTCVRDLISQHQVVGLTGVPSILQVCA
jgi:hypothetical protein